MAQGEPAYVEHWKTEPAFYRTAHKVRTRNSSRVHTACGLSLRIGQLDRFKRDEGEISESAKCADCF